MKKFNVNMVYTTQKKKINNKPIRLQQVFPMFFPAVVIGGVLVIVKRREMEKSLIDFLTILLIVFSAIGVFAAILYLLYRFLEKGKINSICANSVLVQAEVFNIKYVTKNRNRNKHGNRVRVKYYGFDLKFVCDGEEIVRSVSKMFRESVIHAINEQQSVEILYSKKDNEVLLVDEVFETSTN